MLNIAGNNNMSMILNIISRVRCAILKRVSGRILLCAGAGEKAKNTFNFSYIPYISTAKE